VTSFASSKGATGQWSASPVSGVDIGLANRACATEGRSGLGVKDF
jgi:hypothetical protein